MPVDPLSITAASLAANWPYALIGQRWNLQHEGYFSTTGEIVAIHSVEEVHSAYVTTDGDQITHHPDVWHRLFFVRTEQNGLAVIPESSIHRYYRSGEEPTP